MTSKTPKARSLASPMRRAAVTLIGAAALTLGSTAAYAQLEIKLGHVAGPGSLIDQSAQEFARVANERLGNKAMARGMVVTLEHPQAGTTRGIGCPIHFSQTPTDTGQAAPLLGQHTRELLKEHGLTDTEIDDLIEQGAVSQAAA